MNGFVRDYDPASRYPPLVSGCASPSLSEGALKPTSSHRDEREVTGVCVLAPGVLYGKEQHSRESTRSAWRELAVLRSCALGLCTASATSATYGKRTRVDHGSGYRAEDTRAISGMQLIDDTPGHLASDKKARTGHDPVSAEQYQLRSCHQASGQTTPLATG